MTVVAVIAILAGMLFIGARYMSSSAKRDKTRAMQQTLRGMLTERESATDAKRIRDEVDSLYRTGYPAPATYDVNNRIVITLPDASTLTTLDEGLPARYPATSSPVEATRQLMNLLIATPSNKTVVAGMPAESILKDISGGVILPTVLLDGYRNPIIVCPGRGLANVQLVGGANQTITAPDGKPFFASAGPDGNFQTGDDNVYSFEN